MQVVVPAPLVRSLQRLAVAGQVEDAVDGSYDLTLNHGALLGTKRLQLPSGDEEQVAVWGVSVADINGQSSFDSTLPGGIDRIGTFLVVRKAPKTKLEAVALQAADKSKEHGEIVLVYVLNQGTLRIFQCKRGKATRLTVQVVPCGRAREFHRAIGYALVRCAVDLHGLGNKRALLHQVEKYKAATCDDGDFYVRANVMESKKARSFRVLNGHGQDAGSEEATPVLFEAMLPKCEASDDSGEMKKRKTANGNKHKKDKVKTAPRREAKEKEKLGLLPSLEYGDIATVELMVGLGPMEASAVVAAPVVTIPTFSASSSPIRCFSAYCDVLVVVPVDSPVAAVLALLRKRLHHQLSEILTQLRNAPEAVSSVAVHQFPLVGAAFPLTIISSSTGPEFDSDESVNDVEKLERLHRVFLQPLNQSLFRVSRGCSLAQQGEWLAASNVLYNVHEGIPSYGTGSQCHSALVDGYYGYYHYLQQGVKDKGWGCAYRSLQTLASWLFLQHYTQQRFLSHEQIQSVLVKIGDKPPRFQGSTEWIGSLEVGYVLDELFGVSFRSLSVSSGAQLPNLARELLDHFETQGTPVMMGGGQLAFTLLGVDYDPDAGVCAFLTLDPHYTGDEDLTTIQSQIVMLEGHKGLPCSWRKTTTFANNTFYNLCLPQRPSVGF